MLNPPLAATATVRRHLALALAMLLAAGVLTIATAPPAHAAPRSSIINGVTYRVDAAAPEVGATASGYRSDTGPVVVIPDMASKKASV